MTSSPVKPDTQTAPAIVRAVQSLAFEGFGGLALAAEAWGDPESPPVLLLHNGGRSAHDWRGVATALADAGRYAIALDLRGHGASGWAADGRYDPEAYRQDLVAVLRSLSARPVIIAASLSGVAALLALGEGEEHLARALVLVDTCLSIDMAAGERVVERLRADASPSTDPRIFGKSERNAIADRLEQAARHLRLPTMVVHGRDSELVTREAAEELAVAIPGAEFVEVAEAGHYVAADQLDMFNGLVLEFLERRAPRNPVLLEAGSDPRTLRDALGCFATGITVVTTVDGEGKPIGFTANSFTSVSLDPPLILFSLARSAKSLETFSDAGRFAINVLHIGQQPTSARFASPISDRFAETAWEQWDLGVPILSGSLASFECETYAIQEAGDHMIFIGRVRRARFEPQRDPLLYFRGRYRRIHFQ